LPPFPSRQVGKGSEKRKAFNISKRFLIVKNQTPFRGWALSAIRRIEPGGWMGKPSKSGPGSPFYFSR